MHPERVSDSAAKRASDSDREQVVERLRDAAGEGRLDLDEFEERMGAAYQARTYGELDRLTTDLPDTADARLPAGEQRREMTFKAHGSGIRRSGRWMVPARLVVEATHGSVRLDLTRAVPLAAEVEVNVTMKHSSVVLLVPPGTVAIDDGINPVYSSVKLAGLDDEYEETGRSSGRQMVPAVPFRIRLTGELKHSSIKVRQPSAFDLWRRRLRGWWRRMLRPTS